MDSAAAPRPPSAPGIHDARGEDPYTSATMRRTLTREIPSAKAVRAMLGAAPVQADTPLLNRLGADRDAMPHEHAIVIPLSRVKGGRIAHVSQVVGDTLLRVPSVTNETAFALEVVSVGRRYRLDVLKTDLESVHTKEDVIEESREAESNLECPGCGRRFGCEMHFQAHQGAPCASKRKGEPPKKKRRSRKKVTTARIALKDDADVSWRVETAASLVPLLRTDAFWGAPADWAPCAPAADPLKGETARARVLTLRPRAGVNFVEVFGPLRRLVSPAPAVEEAKEAAHGAAAEEKGDA